VNNPTPFSLDWTSLASDWRAQTVVAPDPLALRSHIAQETRRMRQGLIAELALSAVVLLGGAWVLAFHWSSFAALVTFDAWGMLALVWGFAVWNRRGMWRPLAETTAAYVTLARARARRRYWAAWFILLTLAIQFAVVTLVRRSAMWGGHRGGAADLLPAGVTVLFLAWAVWLKRGAERW
jgi:hypothetical protein